MALPNIRAGLRAHLVADAGVTAEVGTRVYPEMMPQNPTLPALTYQQVSQQNVDETLQGSSQLGVARFQISCYAEKYIDADSAARAVDAAMQDFAGTMGSVTVYGVERDNIIDLGEQDGDNITRRVLLDYSIFHRED